MRTQPHWFDTDLPDHPALREDLEVDVLVVGGGITGITTAYLLRKAGLDVALVERDRLVRRDTGHTTAHLTYMADTRLSELCRRKDREEARLLWDAGRSAMEVIRANVTALGIECDLAEVPGYLAAHSAEAAGAERDRLRDEARLAGELGFPVEFIEADPVHGYPALRVPAQMKFHPRKYLAALVDESVRHGVRFYEQSEARSFRDREVEVNGWTIRFDRVVIATHVPLKGLCGGLGAALFQTKLALYSTYAIAARIPKGSFEEMIWSDTAEPFRYLRIEPGQSEDLAIFGGEDHKTGQADDTAERYEALERRLADWQPGIDVTARWSGQVVETNDGFPFIGTVAVRQFIATGFSGNGTTLGTVAAKMARDWVLGHGNPWTACFDPGRKMQGAFGDYVRENSDFPRRLVCDRISVPREDPADLTSGCGKVVRWHRGIVAAYRDPQGTLHLNDAVCPHLGCIVAWNNAEQTWDCPCHGSRFRATGAVIGGPAERGLHPMDNEAAR